MEKNELQLYEDLLGFIKEKLKDNDKILVFLSACHGHFTNALVDEIDKRFSMLRFIYMCKSAGKGMTMQTKKGREAMGKMSTLTKIYEEKLDGLFEHFLETVEGIVKKEMNGK